MALLAFTGLHEFVFCHVAFLAATGFHKYVLFYKASLASTELHEVRLDKLINITVNDRLCISGFIACAQVFDKLIGMEGI